MNKENHFLIGFILGIILTCVLLVPFFNNIVDLPEEISQVTKEDTLRGYYDSNGILHIEFNNLKNRK